MRKLIDDIENVVVKYVLVEAYNDGSYHINILDANGPAHASQIAEEIAELNNITIRSYNEGYYRFNRYRLD